MAEVHALLYIVAQPLNTDDVMERLKISRGNASMSLRALVDWGVVTRVHKRGDRKEYFTAEQDVWALTQAILRERVKREIRPVLGALYDIRELTGTSPAPTRASADDDRAAAVLAHNRRLDDLIDLVRTLEQLSARLNDLTPADLRETAATLQEGER